MMKKKLAVILGTAFPLGVLSVIAVCLQGGYLQCPSPRVLSGTCMWCGAAISCTATSPNSWRDVWPAPPGGKGRDSFKIAGSTTCNWDCFAYCKQHPDPWKFALHYDDNRQEFLLDGNPCTAPGGS